MGFCCWFGGIFNRKKENSIEYMMMMWTADQQVFLHDWCGGLGDESRETAIHTASGNSGW